MEFSPSKVTGGFAFGANPDTSVPRNCVQSEAASIEGTSSREKERIMAAKSPESRRMVK
jgi:hypothetical protein